MTWQNPTRPNKTATLPYGYAASKNNPLVLIPNLEIIRWVENALDHLDQDHSSRRLAAWLVEKTSKEISLQGIVNIWTAHRGPESDNPSALLKQQIKDRNKAAPKGKEPYTII